MGNPDSVLSPWRVDAYPYDILVYRSLPNNKLRSYGFRLTDSLNWNSRQMNQRVARMQTGPRQMHDFSLLNVQVWDRLADGGVGALEGGDSTRYAWAENVFAGDVEGIKLSPVTNLLESFVVVGEKIISFFLWPGPKVVSRSAGASDGYLMVITSHVTNGTKMYRIEPTTDGATVTLQATWASIKTIHTILHRNKLYLSQLPAADTDTNTCIHEISWFGLAWQDKKIKGNITGEHLYSDGKWFYWTRGNLVYRTTDVYNEDAGTAIVSQGPVWVGDGSPINNLLTYGSDEGRSLYVWTWKGIYRILEESGEIKHANAVDERYGTADDEHGISAALINNELVSNYPRGLLRHTLGQTQGSSPWEEEGVPISMRGMFGDMQDGVGGIYIANNPIGDSKATIYRWQEQTWHSFLVYQDPLVEKIKLLYWTTRQVADTARLWSVLQYNGQDRLAWLSMPTSTQNYRLLTGIDYPVEGTLTLPWFKSELHSLKKNWSSVTLDFLDVGVSGSGVVEILGSARGRSDDLTYTSYGTYTCVPANGLTDVVRTWVPCATGQWTHDRIPVAEVSEAVQIQLKLKLGVGAAYPDTGLSDPDGTVLSDGTILLWGTLPPVSDRPSGDTRPLGDSGLLLWQEEKWVRVDLDASHITGVLEIDNEWCWVAGSFFLDGEYYGVVRWNRASGELVRESSFTGMTVTQLLTSDARAIAFSDSVGGRYAWEIADDGTGDWVTKHSFNGPVTLARHVGSSVVVIGDFTEVTSLGIKKFITSRMARIDFSGGVTYNVAVAGPLPEVFHQTRDIRAYANGKIYFAAGTIADGGRLWSVVNEAALTNACTFTAVSTSIANAHLVTSISPDAGYGLLIGLANGGVYQQDTVTPTNPWREIIDSPWDDSLHPVTHFLSGGRFIVADYRNQITSRGRHVSDTQQTEYQAGQLVYIPSPVGVASMPTPVVVKIGLWYVEFPNELMQYQLSFDLSSDTKLLDGTIDPRSSREQREELGELCDLHEFVTVITPDRRAYRGWLGSLIDAPAAVPRAQDASLINERRSTMVTFSQIEELDGPVPYLAPGVYDDT